MYRSLQSPGVALAIFVLLTIATTVTSISQGNPPLLALPISIAYQFPQVEWVENLAVRSNGDILISLLTLPDVYLLDTSDSSVKLVTSIPRLSSLTGITELGHDVFYVAAGNISSVLAITPKSFSVWEVDMRNFSHSGAASTRKVAAIPEAGLLNGIVTLSKVDSTILLADSVVGVVWKLNVKTGAYSIAFSDPTTAPPQGGIIGVNGVKVRDGYLYFTNTGRGLFCRVPISTSGAASGVVEVLATGLQPDDFALDGEGRVWIAQNLASVISVLLGNGTIVDVVNATDPFTIARPTSCAFERGYGEQHFRAGSSSPQSGAVVKRDRFLYCATAKGQVVRLAASADLEL